MFGQIRASTESTGGSANEDWDALVLGAPGRITVRANIMGLPGSIAGRHPELHDGNPGRLDELVVYDPDKLLSTTPST